MLVASIEKQWHVVVIAGEPSGDLHAADFVTAFRELASHTRFSGMGTTAMRNAGVEIVVDSARLAVMGLVEVLGRYGEIRKALATMRRHLQETKPDLLVLVDYVEFNLRLAQTAKQLGIKVLFYVSPQVWAWRPGRMDRIGRSIDAMAVLFPFEVEVYQKHGIAVRYVGNPLVDQVRVNSSPKAIRAKFGLSTSAPLVGLLPGSRLSEVRRHFPVMVKACELLRQKIPGIQFVVAVADNIDAGAELRQHLPGGFNIRLIKGQSHELMAASDALIVASGTATLEAGLLATPMAILYKVSPFTYFILKRFILIPNIGLVNIVAGKRIVQEFVQQAATPQAISKEIERLLTDHSYAESVRQELLGIREKLGQGGASERLAAMAKELLETGHIV